MKINGTTYFLVMLLLLFTGALLHPANAQTTLLWNSTYPINIPLIYLDDPTMQMDKAGNIYVATNKVRGANNKYYSAFLILKYNGKTGDTLWTRECRDTNNYSANNLLLFQLDYKGNSYLAANAATKEKYIRVIKYDVTGNLIYNTRFAATDTSYEVSSVVPDSAGNAYISGTLSYDSVSSGQGSYYKSHQSFFVMKINTAGKRQWQRNGPVWSLYNYGGGIQLLGYNNRLYAFLSYSPPSDSTNCFFMLRYDSLGHETYVMDTVHKILHTYGFNTIFIKNGSVYINDGRLFAIDTAGNLKWMTHLALYQSFINAQNHILSTSGGDTIFTRIIDTSGNGLWKKAYKYSNNVNESTAITSDTRENIYVGAYAGNTGIILHYTPGGFLQGITLDTAPVKDLLCDSAGNIYVTGVAVAGGGLLQVNVRKYSKIEGGVGIEKLNATALNLLVYPQPAQNEVELYMIPVPALPDVKLVLTDLLGRALPLRYTPTGTGYRLYRDALPAGMYLLNVYTPQGLMAAKKIVFAN